MGNYFLHTAVKPKFRGERDFKRSKENTIMKLLKYKKTANKTFSTHTKLF